MKVLHNPPGKLFFKITLSILIFAAVGQRAGYSQPLKEPRTTDWTIPFHQCRAKISDERSIDRLASDNGGFLYLLSSTGTLSSIDITRGSVLWRIDLGSKFVSNLEINDKALFIVVKSDRNNETVTLRSIRKLTGITIWQADFSFAARVSLLQNESKLIAYSDSYVAAFDLSTGDVVSRKKVEFQNFKDIGGLSDNILSELEPFSSSQNAVLNQNNLEISLINGSLFVGDSNGGLISYDKSSGERLWTAKTGGKITSILSIGVESVLAGSLDNFLYLYSSKNGNLKWKRRLPFRIADQPLISDQIAVIGSKGNDQIFILDLESGKILNQILLRDSEYLTANLLYIQDKLILSTTNGIFAYSQYPCEN